MGLDTRELFARLIQCEAGGEGIAGMRAVITQPGQFVCMQETVGGRYNAQNVYNMTPSRVQVPSIICDHTKTPIFF